MGDPPLQPGARSLRELGLVDGRFRVVRPIGGGGMGTIYLALDTADDERPIALKVLGVEGEGECTSAQGDEAETVQATLGDDDLPEATLLSELRHPGIVGYVAHGTVAGLGNYLAMEWVSGEDLGVYLESEGSLSIDEVLRLGLRVAESLAAAHRIGVIHRDIKPANIIVPDRRPELAKIVDFGISQVTPRALYRGGTPGFAAPEQLHGTDAIDARVDVFALGRVLIACVLEGDDDGDTIVTEITAGDLDPDAAAPVEEPLNLRELCPALPVGFAALLQRMVSRDPRERPASAAEVATALHQIITEERGDEVSGITTVERRLRIAIAVPRAVVAEIEEICVRHDAYSEDDLGPFAVMSFRARIAEGDLGVRVGRCALELRRRLPTAPIALVIGDTGQSLEAFRGELEANVALAQRAVGGEGVLLNAAAASVLGVRFEIAAGELGPHLLREATAGARLLLGQPCPWIGREAALEILERGGDAGAGGPVAILVTGEPGMGKTRLVDHFIRGRASASAEVVRARGDPQTAGFPFGVVIQILRSAFGIADAATPSRQQRVLRRTLAGKVPRGDLERLTIFIAELIGAPFPDERSPMLRVARQAPALMAEQTRRAWREVIVAFAAQRPLILWIDDLQWGDLASVRYLDDILDPALGARVLMIAAGRPDLHSRFPSLWARRGVDRIALSGFDEDECAAFVTATLGARPLPPELAGAIVERTQGNPLFLEELIRAVADGAVERLPLTILAILQSRLEALDSEARRILRSASVFGQTFWCEGIASLCGEASDAPGIREWVEALVVQELVVRRPAGRFVGATEYEFRNSTVREAAYASLTAADARTAHAAAGRWLINAGERNPLVLADHFERAGDPVSASEWLAVAADGAFERSEFDAVREIVDRALAVADPGPPRETRGRLTLRRAEVEAVLGDHARAMEDAFAALDALPTSHPRWFSAAGEAALASGRVGAPERVAAIIDRIGEVTPGAGAGENLIGLVRAALPLVAAGAAAAAAELLDKVVAAATALAATDPGALGPMHSASTLRAVARGAMGTALSEMEAAAQAFEAVGSVRNALEHLGGAGFFALELGCLERGEAILRETIQRSAEVGLVHLEAVARHNLGRRIGEAGRVREGLELERTALASFERHRNRRMEGLTLTHIAWILLCNGQVSAAEVAVDDALMRLEGLRASEIVALATRAQIRMRRGEVDAAVDDARRSHDGLLALEGVQEGESLIRLTWAEALHLAGEREASLEAIRAALRRVDERARGIAQEDLQASFRDRVPENARIAALAEAWSATKG